MLRVIGRFYGIMGIGIGKNRVVFGERGERVFIRLFD
jgi:hypothetical protein